ncbi:MAG: hypothetical protein HQM03_21200 [Magnetococcales bacterium]|nr:hypothetical protein [Magnetococcales bacterium]
MRDGSGTLISGLLSLAWTMALAVAAVWLGVWVAGAWDVEAVTRWVAMPSFLSLPLQRQGDNLILSTLAGVVSGLLFLFVAGYVLQAVWDALRLVWVAVGVRRRVAAGGEKPPERWGWMIHPLFTRLWREYAVSLHARPGGGWLATQPAEMVFSHQSLVDLPMRVEFFRHLPGILTGAGIVSTFAGILLGLTGFDPSVGADRVTQELQRLFMGVSTAFTASFFRHSDRHSGHDSGQADPALALCPGDIVAGEHQPAVRFGACGGGRR